MKAERLIELFEEADYEPRSYSGRGMFGRQCVGVALDSGELLSLGAKLAYATAATAELCDIEEQLDDLVTLMDGAVYDQLGLGVIIYWPLVTWPEKAPA